MNLAFGTSSTWSTTATVFGLDLALKAAALLTIGLIVQRVSGIPAAGARLGGRQRLSGRLGALAVVDLDLADAQTTYSLDRAEPASSDSAELGPASHQDDRTFRTNPPALRPDC